MSGHFGGSFFGTKGTLDLTEMESLSCRRPCDNIFRAPKEVFLFGCNTLSGKEPDTRTPQEYRRALRRDGFTAAQADQQVALRYSPIGDSFSARMSTVFSGSQRIYGFSSIAPSGENAEFPLQKYFRKVAPYEDYFAQMTSELNRPLKKAFEGHPLQQTRGATSGAELTCFLENDQIDRARKLAKIEETLKSPQRLSHVTTLTRFMQILRKQDGAPDRGEVDILNRIQQDRASRGEILRAIDTMGDFKYIQGQMIQLAAELGWYTGPEYDDQLRRYIGDLASAVSEETKDQICSARVQFDLNYDKVPAARWGDKNFIALLSCLKPRDPRFAERLLALFKSGDRDLLDSVRQTLPRLAGQSEKILRALYDAYMNDKRLDALSVLINAEIRETHFLDFLLEELFARGNTERFLGPLILKNSYLNETQQLRLLNRIKVYSALGEITSTLRRLQSTDADASVFSILTRSQPVSYIAFNILKKSGASTAVVHRAAFDVLDEQRESERQKALLGLTATFKNLNTQDKHRLRGWTENENLGVALVAAKALGKVLDANDPMYGDFVNRLRAGKDPFATRVAAVLGLVDPRNEDVKNYFAKAIREAPVEQLASIYEWLKVSEMQSDRVSAEIVGRLGAGPDIDRLALEGFEIPIAEDLQLRLFSAYPQQNRENQLKMLSLLGLSHAKNPELVAGMAKLLVDNGDPADLRLVLAALGMCEIQDGAVHARIADFLQHESAEVSSAASTALGQQALPKSLILKILTQLKNGKDSGRPRDWIYALLASKTDDREVLRTIHTIIQGRPAVADDLQTLLSQWTD